MYLAPAHSSIATRCTSPNAVAHHEIPVFLVWDAYSCGHIARYNRHGIRHVRQATTPSRWPFHAADRFVERYFLVTVARCVGAARVNLFQIKNAARSDGDGINDEGSNSEPRIVRHRFDRFKFRIVSRVMISSSKLSVIIPWRAQTLSSTFEKVHVRYFWNVKSGKVSAWSSSSCIINGPVFVRENKHKNIELRDGAQEGKTVRNATEVEIVSQKLSRVIPTAVDTSIAVPTVPKDNSR